MVKAKQESNYKIYLDVCCLNRPFDDWTQERIRLEGEAIRAHYGTIFFNLDYEVKHIMTLVELRQKGYDILVKHLGQVDAIRFLQQTGWGSGDYTQERKETLDKVTRGEFWSDLQRIRNRKIN